MLRRAAVAVLVACLAVSLGLAAEQGGGPGLGGTGALPQQPGGGLGGTGVTADDQERGIGGTGRQLAGEGPGIGGTGIIGTITAFGSIWVNDLEVHYPSGVPVTLFDGMGRTRDLRVGQVVEVEAHERNGRLEARGITVRHAVAGPVTSIDRAGGGLVVLGQRVRIPEGDPLFDSLEVGDRIAVSGLRDAEGRVIASRLDTPPAGVPGFVRGTLDAVDADGLVVGGQRFVRPPGVADDDLVAGREMTLYADADGERLRGRRLRLESEVPFAGRVREMVVEGYVGPRGRRVGRFDVAGTARGLRPGERVVATTRVGADRRIVPDSVRVRPSTYRVERRDLRRGGPERRRPPANERRRLREPSAGTRSRDGAPPQRRPGTVERRFDGHGAGSRWAPQGDGAFGGRQPVTRQRYHGMPRNR